MFHPLGRKENRVFAFLSPLKRRKERKRGRDAAGMCPPRALPKTAALIALHSALYAPPHPHDGAAKGEVARLTAWECIMGVPAVARRPLTVPESHRCRRRFVL
ncbi:hypothetical protein E2C01_087432 [Portunus trituberculatus]|uniref:Uncharacterized protein n=1 Tax=Portunus trituberculatus TaxID=210409 RepID=A0A5B7JBT3_PORTR|nr:hypothetical protein [Portunus trituberculatus]